MRITLYSLTLESRIIALAGWLNSSGFMLIMVTLEVFVGCLSSNIKLISISDSFDSDDSKDYEEPPPPLQSFVKRKPCPPAKGKLNNLSSAFHDYDEPESIIVIPDNENDSPEQVISCGNDFHDYADPDDTDEDNVKCHVTPQEDLSCYHDYDDPAE